MTEATIHYNPRTGEPAIVLIDGDSADVPQMLGGVAYDPAYSQRYLNVDMACRTLGWRIATAAPILRQSNNRGTVRVEPFSLRPGPPPPQPAPDQARVTSTETPNGVTQLVITIDGITAIRETSGTIDDLDPASDRAAREAVDAALADIGYVRSGPLTRDGEDTWGCVADRTGRSDQPADWRDHPTLVRISDRAAAALNELSAKLGIPGDQLASEWVCRAAAVARSNHERYTSPGCVVRGNRIARWLEDGTGVIVPEIGDQP